MQNRHFCKKIFRKRQFFNLLLNYKKIDLEGQYNFQKSDIKQKLLPLKYFDHVPRYFCQTNQYSVV